VYNTFVKLNFHLKNALFIFLSVPKDINIPILKTPVIFFSRLSDIWILCMHTYIYIYIYIYRYDQNCINFLLF